MIIENLVLTTDSEYKDSAFFYKITDEEEESCLYKFRNNLLINDISLFERYCALINICFTAKFDCEEIIFSVEDKNITDCLSEICLYENYDYFLLGSSDNILSSPFVEDINGTPIYRHENFNKFKNYILGIKKGNFDINYNMYINPFIFYSYLKDNPNYNEMKLLCYSGMDIISLT